VEPASPTWCPLNSEVPVRLVLLLVGDPDPWRHDLRQELLPNVRVPLIEPGVVATELPNHITQSGTKEGVGKLYSQAEVTAVDIAEVIVFVIARPRRLAIHEVLLRPAGRRADLEDNKESSAHGAPPAQPTPIPETKTDGTAYLPLTAGCDHAESSTTRGSERSSYWSSG